jgi:chemotaxis protein methyltransferase CheR
MSLTPADFDYVRALVRQRAAIVLDDDKAYLAETRLLPLARALALGSVTDLVARLRAGPANGLHRQVVEAMTTNETSFFRDILPFESLRREVLPELRRRRTAERRLRLWSAACSTGQEPYCLAMLLCEQFGPPAGWDVRVVASDLSTEVLERARRGRYSQLEVSRGLPAPLLARYFQPQGAEWQVKDDVRRLVDYRQLNLIEPWPDLPPLDVIFLRNVLIYFDVATKRQVLGRVRRLLRPDGYLFLGGAETTLNLDDAFERVEFQRAGCYRLRQK